MPRLRHLQGGFVSVSRVLHRRRGDNTPMVRVSIKGNAREEYQKAMRTESKKSGVPNMKSFSAKIYIQEKQYLEEQIKQNPEQEEFLRKKISTIEHQEWILGKDRREPPKYLLVA